MIFYLKHKYPLVTGKILYSFFNDTKKDENSMTEADYKNFILMNFNKETINLNNEEEEKILTDLLLEIMD